jgi:hypothetical protein
MSRLYFKEEQKFNQWWIWVINILLVAIVLFSIGRELLIKINAGTATTEGWLTLLIILIPVIILITFNIVKLETIIRSEGIYYRFKPFRRKPRFHKWSEIDKVYVRKYNPIKEYGGWGYKTGMKKSGTAFNVMGNMGLQLELSNGKKILIGTQKPEELERIIRKLEVRSEK